jgi:hypothetical protein
VDAETTLKILSFTIGLIGGACSAAWAGVRWYAAQERAQERLKAEHQLKEYAAQRDFNHLKNSQDQLSQAIQQIGDEMEKLSLKMMRLEITLAGSRRSNVNDEGS